MTLMGGLRLWLIPGWLWRVRLLWVWRRWPWPVMTIGADGVVIVRQSATAVPFMATEEAAAPAIMVVGSDGVSCWKVETCDLETANQLRQMRIRFQQVARHGGDA